MTIKTLLLSGALALAAVTSSGVLAQTAKDYARYSTYTAPRAQGITSVVSTLRMPSS